MVKINSIKSLNTESLSGDRDQKDVNRYFLNWEISQAQMLDILLTPNNGASFIGKRTEKMTITRIWCEKLA